MTTLPPHIANAETPRSNKEAQPSSYIYHRFVSSNHTEELKWACVDLARQLERENIYLREVLEKMALPLRKYQARYHGAEHAQKNWDEGQAAISAYEQMKKDLAI